MKNTNHSNVAKKLMLAFQQDEVNSAAIYSHFAHCNKDAKNCKILSQIAQEKLSDFASDSPR